jgi:hypothetical protein
MRKSAFTLVETLVVVVTVVILTAMVLPVIFKSVSRSSKIGCVNMLKQQGIAFRIFSTDNGNKYPWAMAETNGGTFHPRLLNHQHTWAHFVVVSNELNTPKVLVCPSDQDATGGITPKDVAKDFTALASQSRTNSLNRGISYLIGLSALEDDPTSILGGDRNITADATAPTVRLYGSLDDTANNGVTRLSLQELSGSSGVRQELGYSPAIHGDRGNVLGNVLLGDGSVQQGTSARLRAAVRQAITNSRSGAIQLIFPNNDGQP